MKVKHILLNGALLALLLLCSSSVSASDNVTVDNATINNMSFVSNSTTDEVNNTSVDNSTTDDVNNTTIEATGAIIVGEEGLVLGLPKKIVEGVIIGVELGLIIGGGLGAWMGGHSGAVVGAIGGAAIGLFIATIKELYKIHNSNTVDNSTTNTQKRAQNT